MPAVFVHGVPETAAVWDWLRARLRRPDSVALQLPGFGCPRPEGFDASKEAYVDWLIGALEPLAGEGPVDLVGHDWGGGLVVRLVSTHPHLVRSWVTDAAAMGDVEQEWHSLAKVWQTPGAGEEFFEQQLAAPPEVRIQLLEAVGVPATIAPAMAGWGDETMAACILALYRSAVEVGREWGPAFADIPCPGLVLVPTEDPFQAAGKARGAAGRAGARAAELDGLGHWWMLQDPEGGARLLEEFWASVPPAGD